MKTSTARIVDGPMTGNQPGAFFTTSDSQNFIHLCPRCGKGMSLWVGARGNGHQLISRNPLTIQGSIVCPRGCKAHYFAIGGMIIWAADAA
jgi:hypothetical protein